MRGILYREILNRLPANSTLGTMVDDWFGAAQGFKDELEADGHNETAAAVSDIIEEQRRFQKCATAHAEEG